MRRPLSRALPGLESLICGERSSPFIGTTDSRGLFWSRREGDDERSLDCYTAQDDCNGGLVSG